MQRSAKARTLATQAGKLLDSVYHEYGPTRPHELDMAAKAVAQASDALLIAAHYFEERERKEAEFKATAGKYEQTTFEEASK